MGLLSNVKVVCDGTKLRQELGTRESNYCISDKLNALSALRNYKSEAKETAGDQLVCVVHQYPVVDCIKNGKSTVLFIFRELQFGHFCYLFADIIMI